MRGRLFLVAATLLILLSGCSSGGDSRESSPCTVVIEETTYPTQLPPVSGSMDARELPAYGDHFLPSAFAQQSADGLAARLTAQS